mmetsp:Transcript_12472/g.36786  ORF Transcript_12472/g.36786 Transcript_12472/m.36786 type:complete len:347 (+) Transcript_12472:413-1453(+)
MPHGQPPFPFFYPLLGKQTLHLPHEFCLRVHIIGEWSQLLQTGEDGSPRKHEPFLHGLGKERLEQTDERLKYERQVEDHGRTREGRVQILVLVRRRGQGLGESTIGSLPHAANVVREDDVAQPSRPFRSSIRHDAVHLLRVQEIIHDLIDGGAVHQRLVVDRRGANDVDQIPLVRRHREDALGGDVPVDHVGVRRRGVHRRVVPSSPLRRLGHRLGGRLDDGPAGTRPPRHRLPRRPRGLAALPELQREAEAFRLGHSGRDLGEGVGHEAMIQEEAGGLGSHDLLLDGGVQEGRLRSRREGAVLLDRRREGRRQGGGGQPKQSDGRVGFHRELKQSNNGALVSVVQ